jgi:hypothetical protein
MAGGRRARHCHHPQATTGSIRPIVLYLNRDPPNMTADNPDVKEEHR